jgi:drug/metabolite transporter (DMT)-like permease
VSIVYWGLLITGVLLSALGGILLKLGSSEISHGDALLFFKQVIFNWKIIMGIACYILPSFIWIFMLKKLDISYLQPLFSLIYVVTPILAFLILHENIPLNRIIGIAVIVIGVIVTALG